MPAVPRAITGFSQDAEGLWVARLACGHGQHVRHDPPWQLRPWVLTEEGRAVHIGLTLACAKCSMPELPVGLERYNVVGPFGETTTPAGLLRRHTLKAGVWGRIVVLEGELLYVLEREPDVSFVLTSEQPGIVLPEEPHHIAPRSGVRFQVEFWRAPGAPGAPGVRSPQP